MLGSTFFALKFSSIWAFFWHVSTCLMPVLVSWKFEMLQLQTFPTKVPSSSTQTTRLPLRHWSLDLVQQNILFRGARMARRLMLVIPIIPIFKNSFVATWLRWIPLSIVSFHITSRISSCLGSYVMLIRLTLEYYLLKDFAKLSLHIVLQSTKQIPTCFVPSMISRVAIGSML